MFRSSLALDYGISESYNVCLFQTKGKMINYLHLTMIICHFSTLELFMSLLAFIVGCHEK
jgi:hypothetical protein